MYIYEHMNRQKQIYRIFSHLSLKSCGFKLPPTSSQAITRCNKNEIRRKCARYLLACSCVYISTDSFTTPRSTIDVISWHSFTFDEGNES